MPRLPDFVGVGAFKAGSTSLHHYLRQHPDIFMPEVKECRFFSDMPEWRGPTGVLPHDRPATTLDEYAALFEPGCHASVAGEITPSYLCFHDSAIANIKKLLPREPKIVMVLRNPVDRAYSNYVAYVDVGLESATQREQVRQRLRVEQQVVGQLQSRRLL